MYRAKGKAHEQACAHCDSQAAEWAYTHDDPNERVGSHAGVGDLAYSLDPERYIALCKSCHAHFDARVAA